MNKKVNVILSDILKPAGGPSGYLYNLLTSLQNNHITDIKLITKGLEQSKKHTQKNQKSNFFKTFENFFKTRVLPSRYNTKRKDKKLYETYLKFFKNEESSLFKSRINHFHNCMDFYYFKKIYPNNTALSIITSHSPQPAYKEFYDGLIYQGYSIKKATEMSLSQKEIDRFAFMNSDYIVFPCEQAVEPYKDFLQEYNISKDKIKYVITSSEKMKYSKTNEEFRKEFSIPENAIVLSYVGRKNHIKGFDLFNELASRFKNDERFYFISAGIGPINPIEMKNFIDIGWTNDPGSIINASNYVVVPNRDTYFDLGVIQAMSLGKTIITTPTGGNKWFMDKDLDFIFFNIDALDSLVETVKTRSVSNAIKNEQFFNEILENDFFALNYSTFYNSILENNLHR
jgi:glycosyltransferase involved in cell wall biosynthesis